MKKTYISISSLITCIILVLIFIPSLKLTVLNINEKYKIFINSFFPQGWGFFTKNPTEEYYVLYEKKNNKIITFKNGDIENYFGFSKMSRRLGIESERLLNKRDSNNLEKKTFIIKRDNSFRYIKEGEYYFLKHQTTPILYQDKIIEAIKDTIFIKLIK